MTELTDWSGLKGLKDLRPVDARHLFEAMYQAAEIKYEKTCDPWIDGFMTALDCAMQVAEKIRDWELEKND